MCLSLAEQSCGANKYHLVLGAYASQCFQRKARYFHVYEARPNPQGVEEFF